MSIILKQSTQIKVRIGPAVAVGDGFTPVTTLALSTADEAELLKADGAGTVDISGATMAAITGADGWYDLTLTTSHTDTIGELIVAINDDSLILPVYQKFQVVEESVYVNFFASGAVGPLTAAQVNTEADTALTDYDGPTKAELDVLGTAALATSAKQDIIDGILDTLLAALVPVNTTIATLASQTSFTLTAGSADNDAYNGWIAVVQDVSTATQYCVGVVEDYVGSTKTVTLAADPGVFTMATTDKIRLLPPSSLAGILAASIGYGIDGAGTAGDPWGPA
jgi:hypothetical protein